MLIFTDGMTTLREEIEARSSFNADEAKAYTEKALAIIQDHMQQNFWELGISTVCCLSPPSLFSIGHYNFSEYRFDF